MFDRPTRCAGNRVGVFVDGVSVIGSVLTALGLVCLIDQRVARVIALVCL